MTDFPPVADAILPNGGGEMTTCVVQQVIDGAPQWLAGIGFVALLIVTAVVITGIIFGILGLIEMAKRTKRIEAYLNAPDSIDEIQGAEE